MQFFKFSIFSCDYCTASFHLTCHDPPLEETDIPTGLWHCHTCRMKDKYAKEKEERDAARKAILDEKLEKIEEIQVDETLPIETEEVKESSETEKKEETELMEVDDENKKEDGDEKVEIESTTTQEIKENIEEELEDEKLTPFEELIRAASLLNPRQFELPPQMTDNFPFPGSDRVESIKNGRRVKTKRLVELDSHGCVPMPAKFCFSCNKTCKRAPLVSCDYCSLYFHQDCLDPPMTALPSGRWMCPNHPQHFIDWNLVSSISATERMKIWDEYGAEPIDHEVVKLQFFRKIHMKNPPFRAKLKRKARDEVEIPEIIRYQYENPPKLLPSLRDVYRIDNIKKRGTCHIENSKQELNEIDMNLEELANARKRIKTIFEDQEDIHGLLIESEVEEIEDEKEKNILKSPKGRKSKSTNETKNDDIKEVVEDNEPKIENVEKQTEIEVEIKQENNVVEKSSSTILSEDELRAINEQLENLNEDTIKLLAFQRFIQIVNENPNFIQKFQDKSTASKTITEVAKWDTNRFPIPLPNKIEDDVIVRLRETPFHLRNDNDRVHSVALSLEKPIKRSKIRSRAVFTFANDYLSGRVWFSVAPSLKSSVYMRYRNFSIGYGAENDLDLSRFGQCAYVSPKHATVFFDDVTKQFELMNYSEFGSEVNGQVFSCDFTEHSIDVCETPTSPLKEKRIAVQSKIKNMIDAKKKIREGIEKTGNDLL
jgi:hypothetical protein